MNLPTLMALQRIHARQAREALAKAGERPMTHQDLAGMKPGTTIRHRDAADAMVVTGCYGTRLTAIRTADVTNPAEWLVVE